MAADEQQQSFGWTPEEHKEREDLIRHFGLPKALTVDDGSVSKANILAFLFRLNTDSGIHWCSLSQEEIADWMGVDVKTVQRIVKACVHVGLIEKKRKKLTSSGDSVTCNHYRIVWSALESRINRGHPESERQGASPPGAPRIGSGAPGGRSEAGHPPPNRPSAPTKGTDQTDTAGRPKGHSDRAKATSRPDQSDTRPPHHGDGVLGDNSKSPAPFPSAPVLRSDGDGVLDFRWGRNVESAELRDPEAIDRLFEIAVGQGAATWSDIERRTFFSLVAYTIRLGRTVGFLTGLLAGRYPNKFARGSRDWRTRPQNLDDTQALRWLARIDGDQAAPASPRAAYHAQLQEAANQSRAIEDSRARQIAALKGGR